MGKSGTFSFQNFFQTPSANRLGKTNAMSKCILTTIVILKLLTSQCPAEELPYRGAAEVKAAWVIPICIMKLYLSAEVKEDEWMDNYPIALEVKYSRSIKSELLIKLAEQALKENFNEATNAKYSNLRKRIHNSYIDVSRGDCYRIHHAVDEGLKLFLNEKLVIHIPDDDFARYYLHVWLGKHKRAKQIKVDLFHGTESLSD